MSKLLTLQDTVQQICTAITSVLNIESMVLDENLQIVAGTGKYRKHIGTFEAEAFLPEEYLYKYILRKGDTYVVDNTSDPLYGPEQYGETGEICCAIPYKTGTIGIISLVAFDESQYDRLIGNSDNICEYLRNMALLLSSFLQGSETLERIGTQARLLNEVVESSPHCIITMDRDGKIISSNSKARRFFQGDEDEFWGILGKNLDQFWTGACSVILDHGEAFRNKELTFNDGNVNIVLSSRIIYNEDSIEQVVIFFDDIIEAKQNAYALLDEGRGTIDEIVGSSLALKPLKDMIPTIASSSSTVLIMGESGTGKELFAKAIHFSSQRSSSPFVTINCGAIPENLMEAELFGYEKGAFTGASSQGQVGKLERADGGTVFIDEIGDLPLHMQMKLLHVLQRKEFERIGGSRTISIDVRFIAATNRNLEQMIDKGTFRDDLYYRLNVIPMHIPPLRERPEDIPSLINHFISRYSMQLHKNVRAVSDDVMSILLSHNWPGNVRELQNAIEYSINMTSSPVIDIDDLSPYLREGRPDIAPDNRTENLKMNMENYENQVLLQELKNVEDGKITKDELARKLGISRSSLYRRIRRIKK